jgi:prolyl oligopeptidase
VALEPAVSVKGFERGAGADEILVDVASFHRPARRYAVALATGRMARQRDDGLSGDGADFRTEVREVATEDGAAVPLFLTATAGYFHRRSAGDRAGAPTLLQVYGGFGMSMVPAFRWMWRAWLESGGLLACAGVRGGSERGSDWHRLATRTGKPKTFADVVAVARYLSVEGYCRPPGPVVYGASNGGLSAAAAVVRAPACFAGLITDNALLDMCGYEDLNPAAYWVEEFGSVRDARERDVIAGYCPTCNVVGDVTYPPTLLFASANDALVDPVHTYRFARRLSRTPSHVLLRIDEHSGHGRDKPVRQLCAERADLLAFAMSVSGRTPKT